MDSKQLLNTKKLKELKKKKRIRYTVSAISVIASALLQVFVIQTFIRPAGILSGGFTGLAILIDRITSLYGFGISTSILLLLLNLPVALICCKSISIKFTVFSLIQVTMSSFFLTICDFQPIFDDIVLNVIFGGVLNGLFVLTALKGNASTGGTDFIALYVSNKTGRSIWTHVFMMNVCILVVFGFLFGWLYAGYSIIFQFISTQMISAFHHRFERVTLQITTSKSELVDGYVSHFRHGMSCVKAIGGYSKKEMYLLHTVVSSYEVTDIVHYLKEVDSHVIINVLKTQEFHGRFYRAPMD